MDMKRKNEIALVLTACTLAVGLLAASGCATQIQQQEQSGEAAETEASQQEADFSSISDIANLTTIEAQYHDVAKFSYEADEGLTGIWKHGYKKAWREYDGRAYFGIEASMVETSREGDVVTVKMPHATLVGEPKITKMGELIVETGFLTDFTAEDETEMNKLAQEQLRNTAANDTSMINRATNNAQKILKQWAESVGVACGENLEVNLEFVD